MRKFKKDFEWFFFQKIKSGIRPESALDSYFCKTFHRICLTVFWICLGFWIYHGSEYASKSKYARILNIPSTRYTKILNSLYLGDRISTYHFPKFFRKFSIVLMIFLRSFMVTISFFKCGFCYSYINYINVLIVGPFRACDGTFIYNIFILTV